jgi:hypothetical protein
MQITATHCCVCRAPLTDALSIESSIGPICSRRYYNPQHTPTVDQVRHAIGKLVIAGLPDEVMDGCLALSHNDKANAREISNLLVKYASLHYNDRDEVLKCSGIMRALGYVELADKLELDRTVASVMDKGDTLEVFIPDQWEIQQAIRQIPGCQPLMVEVEDDGPLLHDPNAPPREPRKEQVKRGRRMGWTVPKVGLDHLMCLFGVFLPDELVSFDGGDLRKIAPRSRYDLYVFTHPKPVGAPVGVSAVTPKGVISLSPKSNGKLEVRSPFNRQFIDALKVAVRYNDRRWDDVGKCWEVAIQHTALVKTLIATHYQVTI